MHLLKLGKCVPQVCVRNLAVSSGTRALHPTTRIARSCVPLLLGGGFIANKIRRARCEAVPDPWLLVPQVVEHRETLRGLITLPLRFVVGVLLGIRKLIRCISLFLRFFPLAITYPIASRVPSLDNVWWSWMLFTVQCAGPTLLKLGQWASTRRDIFSKEFCDKLCILHTKTKNKRYFRDQAAVIDELFGKGFYSKHKNEVFVNIEPYSIGSGCIAQVYKATVNIPALEKATGVKVNGLDGQLNQEIAIKVADRDVEKQIELDLSIIRSTAWFFQTVLPGVHFVDPLGAIDQFEMVLRRQVDLRNEAKALMKFAENFDPAKTGIRFPVVIAYTKNILAETFEEGMYINRLVAEEDNPELQSKQSPAVRHRIALLGARALLKMIFVDNFVHGDLHPGNILIRFNDDVGTLPGVHLAPPPENVVHRWGEIIRDLIGWRSTPKVRFTDSPFMADEPTLVLLDTGISISETEEKLTNLKLLFRAIVERNGYAAGQMILAKSPKQECKDPEKFCQQVHALVDKAMSTRSLRKLNISGVLSEMFSVVAEHKVSLDSSFTAIILSVMVLEGFGRSLDPELDLFQCARPYLLNVMF